MVLVLAGGGAVRLPAPAGRPRRGRGRRARGRARPPWPRAGRPRPARGRRRGGVRAGARRGRRACSTRPARRPRASRRVAARGVVVERRVPGIEGTARVLRAGAGRRAAVVVVGQSLDDRDETLAGLRRPRSRSAARSRSLLASLLGYALAAAGAARRSRRCAAARREVSLERRRRAAAAAGRARRGPPARRDAQRDARPAARARSSASAASWPTPATSCARRVAVIKTELEGALRAGGHEPEVREALVAAVEECDHLAQLAEDLLVLARAAEGRLPVRRERLDARELLEACARALRRPRGARGRAIDVDAADGLRLDADALRLRQALGNLVDNALRHGEGDVVLRARGRRRRRGARGRRRRAGLPAGARASAPSSASRAATRRARAAAPGSASRSCARSPRPTAAARRSCPAPAPRCGSGCPSQARSQRARRSFAGMRRTQGGDMKTSSSSAHRRWRVAALAAGGAAVAGAAGGDDDATERPISGRPLDRASAAALDGDRRRQGDRDRGRRRGGRLRGRGHARRRQPGRRPPRRGLRRRSAPRSDDG